MRQDCPFHEQADVRRPAGWPRESSALARKQPPVTVELAGLLCQACERVARQCRRCRVGRIASVRCCGRRSSARPPKQPPSSHRLTTLPDNTSHAIGTRRRDWSWLEGAVVRLRGSRRFASSRNPVAAADVNAHAPDEGNRDLRRWQKRSELWLGRLRTREPCRGSAPEAIVGNDWARRCIKERVGSRRYGTRPDGTVVWHLGNLAPGEKRTVHATMLVTRPGLLLDTAVTHASNADPAVDQAPARVRPAMHPPPLTVTG